MPRRNHWIGLSGLLALTVAFAADTPSKVQVALSLVQPNSSGGLKTAPLTKTSLPKPGNRLLVRVAVTEPCHVLVVAFDSAGKVAYPDQPVIVEMEANTQQQIPGGDGWKWENPEAVRELDVVLVDHRSPSRRALTKLIEAMQEQAVPAVRARQVIELRRMIDSLTQRDAASAEYSVKTEPVPLGGLVRGEPCIWCKDAQKISLPPAGSYLVRQRFQ